MTEHLYSDKLTAGTADIILDNLTVYCSYLINIEFTCKNYDICKTSIEAQSFDIGYVKLRAEMYLLTYAVAIFHDGDVAGNDGTDVCCPGSI